MNESLAYLSAFYLGGYKEMSSITAVQLRPSMLAQMRGGGGYGVSAN